MLYDDDIVLCSTRREEVESKLEEWRRAMVNRKKPVYLRFNGDWNLDGNSDFLTRFNKIATQGAPQMAVDKEANSLSRVYSYYSKFNLRLFYV